MVRWQAWALWVGVMTGRGDIVINHVVFDRHNRGAVLQQVTDTHTKKQTCDTAETIALLFNNYDLYAQGKQTPS